MPPYNVYGKRDLEAPITAMKKTWYQSNRHYVKRPLLANLSNTTPDTSHMTKCCNFINEALQNFVKDVLVQNFLIL